MKSRLGLRLWVASTVILLLSLGLFAAIGIRLLVQFGEETARTNEQSILNSAEGFLSRSAYDRALWCDELFRRIANGAVSIAGKASRIYAAPEASKPADEMAVTDLDLVVCERNGIFTNAASSDAMILYWGGPRIYPAALKEINALAGLDDVLADVLAQNPEIIADFFVSQTGMARYQPNVHNVGSIPKGFDIRKATWYEKATPEQNPEKTVVWSNVYSDILGRGLMITAAMPAFDASDRFMGAAGVDLTLASLLKQLGADISSPHKIQGMFVFLLDAEGRIIAFPPDELPLFGIAMDTRDLTDSSRILGYTLQDSTIPAVRKLGAEVLVEPHGVFPVSIGNTDLLVASHLLALTGWKLNLVIPRQVILESVIQGRQQLHATVSRIKWTFLLVSLGFVLLSLTVGTLLFLKYLVVPLRELEKGAARVQSGDLDTPIPALRNDEIGSLAASFNEMMGGLRKGRELEENYAGQLKEEIQKKTHEIEQRKDALEQTLKTLEQEIQERKEIEAALRRSESEKALILDSTVEMFAYYDLDLRIRWANKAAGDSLGQPADALMGRYCYELWHGRPEPCDHCPVLLAARTGRPQQTEMTSPDGRVWQVRGYPIKDDKGEVAALVELTQEITAQKKAEAEKAKFEALNRQIQKAESLRRMAGAVAHHFNNQLQAVIGHLELAAIEFQKTDGPVESMMEAMKAAHRAADVSRQMLTYLGQSSGKRETVDLSGICRRILPGLRPAMPANVLLKAHPPSPGPAVLANPNQMEQLLTNLINNASEAMPETGGTIRVSLKTVSPEDIPSRRRFPLEWAPEDTAYACLEVRDTGTGIAEQEMEKLFDPFYSTKFTGRGLGLPVVLGIVRAHHGAVAVESRSKEETGEYNSEEEDRAYGSSSVFRVFLPLSTEEAPPRSAKESQPLQPEGGGTVLLVEDTPQVRQLGVYVLESLGWTVLAAKDGAEGVEMFQKHRDEVRFVICDLTMPRMDGWETIAALRKLSPDIPVILASGYDKASVMTGDHPEWPQAFLSKPYVLQDLRDAIAKVTGVRNLESRS